MIKFFQLHRSIYIDELRETIIREFNALRQQPALHSTDSARYAQVDNALY